MRKAKNQDVLDVIDYFTNKYDIDRNQVEPLVFKIILDSPLYAANVTSRLVITDQDEHPLSLAAIRENTLLLAKYVDNSDNIVQFGGLRNRVQKESMDKIKLVFKESEIDNIKELNDQLHTVTDFKSLISLAIDKDSDNNSLFFSKFTGNELFNLIYDIKFGRTIDNDTTMIQNNIANRLKNLTYKWQIEPVYINTTFKNFNDFEEHLYEQIRPLFDLFYYEQELKLGTLALSNTEESLMKSPLANDIEDYLHLNFPEYFMSRDLGINEYMIDDIDLKFGGKSFTEADIHHTVVYNSDLPSIKYFDGVIIDNIDEGQKDLNSVRFIGENTFFTDYYLFLRHTKTDGGLNQYEITNPMFNKALNPEIVKNVLDKCLEFANKNKSILNINEYDKNIDGFDFGYVSYIKEKAANYPDVILINSKVYNPMNYELLKIASYTEAKNKFNEDKQMRNQKNNI